MSYLPKCVSCVCLLFLSFLLVWKGFLLAVLVFSFFTSTPQYHSSSIICVYWFILYVVTYIHLLINIDFDFIHTRANSIHNLLEPCVTIILFDRRKNSSNVQQPRLYFFFFSILQSSINYMYVVYSVGCSMKNTLKEYW